MLPPFPFVTIHRQPLADGVAHEAAWLAAAAAQRRPSAQLWTAPTGLVVPRRTTTLPGWPAARAAAADGRFGELRVRSSGGGLVPQGPGVWNLTLCWPAPAGPAQGAATTAGAPTPLTPAGTEAIYQALCQGLAAAFARLGLACRTQPVSGSFCDGRYNLAVGGAKLVGTAQAWRRVAGVPMVLAHAVILLRADPVALCAQADAFEAALGSPTRYRPEALTSLAHAAGAWQQPGFEDQVLALLAQQFARAAPPRVLATSPPEVFHHGLA